MLLFQRQIKTKTINFMEATPPNPILSTAQVNSVTEDNIDFLLEIPSVINIF